MSVGLSSLRRIFPALVDTHVFSCIARTRGWSFAVPALQSKVMFSSEAIIDNKDLKVNHSFVNRNPRNLEFMGIEEKREGWQFQYPPKNYYHKLIFKKTNRNIHAYVEHWTGKTVVSASTSEEAIMKHLYSMTDSSAAENIARIMARRCLQAGITQVHVYMDDNVNKSKKATLFYKTVEENGIELQEPERVIKEYEQGTDYDRPADA